MLLFCTGLVASRCGGTFTEISGTFTSPNHPEDYGNDLQCVYYIRVDTLGLSSINITIHDLNLENVGPAYFDYIDYGMGWTVGQFHLGELHGTMEEEQTLRIETDYSIWLLFESDESNYRPFSGFSLSWEIGNFLPLPPPTHTPIRITNNNVKVIITNFWQQK